MSEKANRKKLRKNETDLWIAPRYSLKIPSKQLPWAPGTEELSPTNRLLELADTAMELWQNGLPKKSRRKAA